jgi:hypothetical protein
MLLRLIPDQGGDGTVHGIIAMNDTRSDILSLFNTDMPHLGNLQGYAGFVGNVAWSDWIVEEAMVQPLRPGVSRLSGIGIRGALYIGTAPGNHFLAVAATKGGLNSLF